MQEHLGRALKLFILSLVVILNFQLGHVQTGDDSVVLQAEDVLLIENGEVVDLSSLLVSESEVSGHEFGCGRLESSEVLHVIQLSLRRSLKTNKLILVQFGIRSGFSSLFGVARIVTNCE